MSRPRKDIKDKRVHMPITTLPVIKEFVDKKRGYQSRSEYVHRLLVSKYNAENPDDQIEVWEPKSNGKR